MVKMSSFAAYISLHIETIITYTSRLTTSNYYIQFISKYERLGKLYISGDFNARTGNSQNDRLQRNHYLQEVEYEHFDVQARVNKDHVVDVYGRRLLDLCRMTKFLVANGDFTFCSAQGQSTVDYLISSYEDLSHIHKGLFRPHAPTSNRRRLYCIQLLKRRSWFECTN